VNIMHETALTAEFYWLKDYWVKQEVDYHST